jgi:predicted ArsR family transcriptional regulator
MAMQGQQRDELAEMVRKADRLELLPLLRELGDRRVAHSELAQRKGLATVTVRLAMRELRQRGIIEADRAFAPNGRPAPNKYRILLGNGEEFTPSGAKKQPRGVRPPLGCSGSTRSAARTNSQ